jgi:hypothetical protein
MIVAINVPQMSNGANSNNNQKCGRKIRAHGPKGHVDVTVADTCAPCEHRDIDLSPAAFIKIFNTETGRLPLKWHLFKAGFYTVSWRNDDEGVVACPPRKYKITIKLERSTLPFRLATKANMLAWIEIWKTIDRHF